MVDVSHLVRVGPAHLDLKLGRNRIGCPLERYSL
jgi:hypothetical protein